MVAASLRHHDATPVGGSRKRNQNVLFECRSSAPFDKLHEQPDAGSVARPPPGIIIFGDAQVKQFTSAHRQSS
jgi:hypothetical protein